MYKYKMFDKVMFFIFLGYNLVQERVSSLCKIKKTIRIFALLLKLTNIIENRIMYCISSIY
jgi:hypothetical protein